MNFEKLASNYEGFNKKETDKVSDAEKEYKKAISRRDLLERAAGAFISSVSLGGIYLKNNKENGIADASGRLDDIEKRIDNLLDSIDEQKLEKVQEQALEQVESSPQTEKEEKRLEISSAELRRIKPELRYQEIVPPPKIENFNIPGGSTRGGASSVDGKVAMTLLWRNVTEVVEDRYNIPRGILLGMIMQESTGIDLLPNSAKDGGFGLCHMQGVVAQEFALETFEDCHTLICNDVRGCKEGGKLQNHAARLEELMIEKKDDRKTLVEADDRLNVLLNIDAAGRMIASFMSSESLAKDKRFEGLDPLQRALKRYSGRPEYEGDVKKHLNNLGDSNDIDKAVDSFNAANPNLLIDGQPADYYKYIEAIQAQAVNYGIEEYRNLPKYNPANSQDVKNTYGDFL
ncbi:MAG: hypothetical protein WC087_00875 [Candidatus Paceibacterota bacterium]